MSQYAFQSESTLYTGLNVKELLAQSRRKIWRLSDCHNYVVHKRTLNHLAKLVKWLSGCGFESSCSHLLDNILITGDFVFPYALSFPLLDIKKLAIEAIIGKILWRFDIILHIMVSSFVVSLEITVMINILQ